MRGLSGVSAILSRTEAIGLAERVLRARYPEADAGFAAGSFIRGNATPSSDLDFVVLFAVLPNARRESFLFGGVPVDVFVHDPSTVPVYWQKDLASAKPAMLTMIREGVIVGPRPAAAEALKAEAEAMYARGPRPLEPAELERWRYLITDRLGDLRDPRPWPQVVATATWLHPVLAEFTLIMNGRWAATAKWIPAALAAFDPAVEAEFTAAFDALFQRRDVGPVIALGEKTLAPFGGPLFDGYTAEGEAAPKPK